MINEQVSGGNVQHKHICFVLFFTYKLTVNMVNLQKKVFDQKVITFNTGPCITAFHQYFGSDVT